MGFTWTCIRTEFVNSHPSGIAIILKSMLLSFIRPAHNFKPAGINLVFEQAGTREMHVLFATGPHHRRL
eukprot:6004602-Karenia_brevis.AAC.1